MKRLRTALVGSGLAAILATSPGLATEHEEKKAQTLNAQEATYKDDCGTYKASYVPLSNKQSITTLAYQPRKEGLPNDCITKPTQQTNISVNNQGTIFFFDYGLDGFSSENDSITITYDWDDGHGIIATLEQEQEEYCANIAFLKRLRGKTFDENITPSLEEEFSIEQKFTSCSNDNNRANNILSGIVRAVNIEYEQVREALGKHEEPALGFQQPLVNELEYARPFVAGERHLIRALPKVRALERELEQYHHE